MPPPVLAPHSAVMTSAAADDDDDGAAAAAAAAEDEADDLENENEKENSDAGAAAAEAVETDEAAETPLVAVERRHTHWDLEALPQSQLQKGDDRWTPRSGDIAWDTATQLFAPEVALGADALHAVR